VIKPGNIVKDNDPRERGCIAYVVRVTETHAHLRRASGRETRVRLDRIFTDEKDRRSGWSKVR
jgi:hypothetical protein